MKLDTYPQGYDFPGTTNYDDGRLPALPAVVLSAFSFLTNDFSVIRFEHDFIFWEDLQITDGMNTLIKGTDYTMGDKDKCLSDDITEILGTTKTVVNGVIINNIAYHGITLTASGKYVGDSISAREYNANSIIEGMQDLSSGDVNIDLDSLAWGRYHFSVAHNDTSGNKVTFSGATRTTINNRAVADWELKGAGTEINIRVDSSGVYADGDTLIGDYTSGTQKIIKRSSQIMNQEINITLLSSIATAYGSLFRSSEGSAVTRAENFTSISSEVIEMATASYFVWPVIRGNISLSAFPMYSAISAGSTPSISINTYIKTEGKW